MSDFYGFYTGKILDAYEWMGAHLMQSGVKFSTFAPNARGVVLLWNGQEIPMNKIHDGNFYEVYVEGAKEGNATNIVFMDKTEVPLIIVILMGLECS